MGPLPISLGTLFLAVISLVSLFFVDPLIMVVAALMIPATVLINQVFASRMEGPAARWQQELGGIASVAHESLDGVLTVKSLGLESAEIARFRERADTYRMARLEGHRLRAVLRAVDGAGADPGQHRGGRRSGRGGNPRGW